MQETIDVIEDVLLLYLWPILFLCPLEDKVGNSIVPDIPLLLPSKEIGLCTCSFFEPVEREALSC